MPTTTDKPETSPPNASNTTKTNEIHDNWYANGFIPIKGCTSRIGLPGVYLDKDQAEQTTGVWRLDTRGERSQTRDYGAKTGHSMVTS